MIEKYKIKKFSLNSTAKKTFELNKLKNAADHFYLGQLIHPDVLIFGF